MEPVNLYLSRRNLLTLLSKLDRNKVDPRSSQCTIIKRDTNHPTHPQSHETITIQALEDETYYVDRMPGDIHPDDVSHEQPIDNSKDGIIEFELTYEERDSLVKNWVKTNLNIQSVTVFDESLKVDTINQSLYNAVINQAVTDVLQEVIDKKLNTKELVTNAYSD